MMSFDESRADAYIAVYVAMAFLLSIVMPLYTYEFIFSVFREITLGFVSGLLTISISVIYSLGLFQLVRMLPRIQAKKESIRLEMVSIIILQCFVWFVLLIAVQLSLYFGHWNFCGAFVGYGLFCNDQ